jgi:hypothetical protein
VHRAEVRRADIGLDDAALFVDQEGGGRERDVAELARDIARRIERHGKWQLALLGEIEHVVGPVVLHRDGDEFQALALVLVVGRDHVGHLLDAGDARRGPEVDHHDFPAQRLRRHLVAGDADERDVRGRRAAGQRRVADAGQRQHDGADGGRLDPGAGRGRRGGRGGCGHGRRSNKKSGRAIIALPLFCMVRMHPGFRNPAVRSVRWPAWRARLLR